MPTTIYDSSLLTQRRQAKTIANSFLQRLNTDSPVNNTNSFSSPTGIWSDSILNEVATGSMTMYRKSDGGAVCISPCCQAAPEYETPSTVDNIFIYLNCLIVSWSVPINSTKAGVITYNIAAVSSDGGAEQNVSTTDTYYNFEDLTPYKHYTFSITATNASGSSASVTSYSIYSPPLGMQSRVTNLSVTPNGYVWGNSLFTFGQVKYTFVKQNISNDKCYGSIAELAGAYPDIGVSTIFPLSDLIAFATTNAVRSGSIYDLNGGNGVWKTSDGGLSWTSLTKNKIFNTGSPFPDFSYWWNELDGVVIYDDGVSGNCKAYYTSNGGTTWQQSSGIGANYSDASTVTYSVIGNTIWFLSKTFNNTYFINKSTNKGQTFTTIQFINNVNAAQIDFTDENNGIVGIVQTNLIYKTTDGGATWTQIPTNLLPSGVLINVTHSYSGNWFIFNSILNGYLQNIEYLSQNLFTAIPTFSILSRLDNLSQIKFVNNTHRIGYGASNFFYNLIKDCAENTDTIAPPTVNDIYRGDQSVLVNILPPNQFPIRSLPVEIYQGDTLVDNTQVISSFPALITNLENGTPYRFKFKASWGIGEKGDVSESTDFTEEIIPSLGIPVPTRLGSLVFSRSSDGSTNTASFVIIPPANNGGAPITSYSVVLKQLINNVEKETKIDNIVTPIFSYNLSSSETIISGTVNSINSYGTQTDNLLIYNSPRDPNRVPIIHSVTNSGTPNQIIVNVETTSSTPLSYQYYKLYIYNRNNFRVVTSCSPNLYQLINVTAASGTTQNIVVSNVPSGNIQVALYFLNVLAGGQSAAAIMNHTVP